MSLAMIGNQAAFEFRWRRWALLRDTVMSLEPTVGRFPHLFSIGDALAAGSLRVSAAALGEEVRSVMTLLAGHTLDDLAISPSTAAVLYLGTKLDVPRKLTSHERNQIAPPGCANDLAEYFRSMCESMLDVCRSPLDDGHVEILDG
jgi:hypothetical protein